MSDINTRLAAVRDLLDDSEGRNVRKRWEAILDDPGLAPAAQSDAFQKQLYDCLITEMEAGYQRNDALRREKRRRAGRSSGFIPYQMRISSPTGRFLFAYFKWHDLNAISPTADIKTKGLRDIAEAFEFKIDPAENQRQFLTAENRQQIITKERDRSYNKWLWISILSGFLVTIYIVTGFIGRKGGF